MLTAIIFFILQPALLSFPSTASSLCQLCFLPFIMPSHCTKCGHTGEFFFFQPRLATTDENKLLRTCFICHDKIRRSHNAWKHRVVLAELNTNVATIVRRPRENDDNVLPSSVRQRRSVFLSIVPLPSVSPPGFLSPGLPPPDLPPDLFLPNF